MTAGINISSFPGSALGHKVTNRVDPGNGNYVFMLTREQTLTEINGMSLASNINRSVRRPLGLEFKKDTYAYIEVLRQVQRGNAQELVPIAIFNENFPEQLQPKLRDGGFIKEDTWANAAVAPYSNNFLVQQFVETREEKYQLVETFGDNFLFFFGERPRFVDVTGLLVNSNSHRWKREWWLNYDNFLRGSKAVENKSIVTLHVDNVAISGYILTSSSTEVSMNPRQVQFSFRMVVTDYVFEDEDSPNTVSFFGSNLNVNKDSNGDMTGLRGANDVAERLTALTQSALNTSSTYLNNIIVENAVSVVTQAVFGNPFTAVTNGIASAMNVMTLLDDNGIDSIFDVPGLARAKDAEEDVNAKTKAEFASGFGSFVEFNGKPPGLLTVDNGALRGKTTLQEAGIGNLLASMDNSLSVLLNLQRSPVVQAFGVLGDLVEQALKLVGVNTSGYSNAKGSYLDFVTRADKNRSGGYIAGRYMGYDFILPFQGMNITTINPERSRIVGGELAEAVDATGDPTQFTTVTIPYATNSPTIDFVSMKKNHPEKYAALPRQWRLLIEKDPLTASKKLISTSRTKSDGTLELVIRTTKALRGVESTLSRQIEKALS